VPGGTLEIVPGLGHLLHEEAPELASAAIVRAYLEAKEAVAAQ
jgi:pimeloyl-ACP methyl ester carboxylesterase